MLFSSAVIERVSGSGVKHLLQEVSVVGVGACASGPVAAVGDAGEPGGWVRVRSASGGFELGGFVVVHLLGVAWLGE